MSDWTPELAARQGPRYRRIVEALADDIAAGRLAPRTRLPTHRELAWRLGVTVGTVSRAYNEAARRGLIAGEVGRGTYVRAPSAAESHDLRGLAADEPALVDLNFSMPPPCPEERLLPAALAEMAAHADGARGFGYQPHAGHPAHRASGAAWLARRGLVVSPDQVLVTCGAHHAIVTVLAAIARPGDRVLVEALCYSGMQPAARLLGLRLEPVAIDDEGMVPEALDAACRGRDAKAVYLVPTLHNPTNATMSAARREAIVAVARAHDIPIVEDDIFGILAAAAPPPIACLAPERTFYLTSLSKTVAPGLRIGYLAAPPESILSLAAALRAVCWMAAPVTAELASRMVDDGTADKILAGRVRETQARRRIALEALGNQAAACPAESLHLWLTLPEPWQAADFVAEARRRSVGVTPAAAFAIQPNSAPEAVRIGFGQAATRDDLRRGLATLSAILRDAAPARFSAIL